MSDPIRVLELRSVRGTGGGPEKTILLSAAAADPSRFDITVCYIRDMRDDIFALDERAKRLGVAYHEIRERHSFDPQIWPALRALVRDHAIDIVHSHEHKTDLLALMLGRCEPVVPLATAHGWVGQSWRERMYYRADKRLLARFPFVITVSSDIKRELLRYGARAERLLTVLNAIDPQSHRRDPARVADARQALGFGATDIVIGAVGRLERQKRFDVLLQVFNDLSKQQRNRSLKLVLAGDGSLMPPLQKLANDLGVSEGVTFLGNHRDVIGLHHALDLFVQSSEYEGTPNAVLEAMALETPIVATDAGGTAELVIDGEHGLIIPPNDPAALGAAISTALFDRPATKQRAAAARRRVENELSFDARRQKVEAVYEMLVEQRRPKRQAS